MSFSEVNVFIALLIILLLVLQKAPTEPGETREIRKSIEPWLSALVLIVESRCGRKASESQQFRTTGRQIYHIRS